MADRVINDREALALAKQAKDNPWRYFEAREIRAIFNFGERAMRIMMRLNPPMVAEKINPSDFKDWLSVNWERIGKTTAVSAENGDE